jgi:O-antigen/teichoic acid export membrane protein
VLNSYIAGLGHGGVISAANMAGLVANVALNLVLIPRFGILGAATASLISYLGTAVVLTLLAARLARTSPVAFWLPRPADVRLIVSAAMRVVRRVLPTG